MNKRFKKKVKIISFANADAYRALEFLEFLKSEGYNYSEIVVKALLSLEQEWCNDKTDFR